jgi:hypothetical protein
MARKSSFPISTARGSVEPVKTIQPGLLEQAVDSRTKQIIAGLFLSRFDKAGLQALGFSTFTEAFNTIGFALSANPASIKNYRDEFDPIYSTTLKGWRKRRTRAYCKSAS